MFLVESSSEPDRLSANDSNATARPSGEICTRVEAASAPAPDTPVARDARIVDPARRSRTKTLVTAFESSPERLSASEVNATTWPSADMAPKVESASPPTPPEPGAREASVVVAVTRSRTKMSRTPSASSFDRFAATDSKAT